MKPRHVYRTLFILLLFLAFGPTAYGQTAQVTGLITDSGGAVVPGVEVTVSNVDTGVDRKVTSNEEGYYTVPLLTPGTYEILVQKQGFRPITRSGLSLRVEHVARVDFTLEIGELTEQVNISGEAPLLESETASRGQVIGTRAIEELPLNGRNFFREGFKQAVRVGDWKAIKSLGRPVELYDRADREERHDLASRNPEVVTRINHILQTGRTESEHWKVEPARHKSSNTSR